MKKGEGFELAQYYGVNSYPALLFLNSNGDIVQKTRGSMSAEKLIANAKEVLSKNFNNIFH